MEGVDFGPAMQAIRSYLGAGQDRSADFMVIVNRFKEDYGEQVMRGSIWALLANGECELCEDRNLVRLRAK